MFISTIRCELLSNFDKSFDFSKDKHVDNKLDFAGRLRLVAKHYKISINQMSRDLNVPYPTMHSYLNENREPKLGFFQSFVEVYKDISLTWIITGAGEMINEVKRYKQIEEDINIVREQNEIYRQMIDDQKYLISLKEKKERLKHD